MVGIWVARVSRESHGVFRHDVVIFELGNVVAVDDRAVDVQVDFAPPLVRTTKLMTCQAQH